MCEEKVKPPAVTRDPDGWEMRLYSDGNFTRTRKVGTALEIQYTWDPLAETPKAATREFWEQVDRDREQRLWQAFQGDKNSEGG